MKMLLTPEENAQIEESLSVPPELAAAMQAEIDEQDQARGRWLSPRKASQPKAPWPPAQSEMLRYLMWKATASIEAGMDVEAALLQLAVHAWFEGGVANYDRGRRVEKATAARAKA